MSSSNNNNNNNNRTLNIDLLMNELINIPLMTQSRTNLYENFFNLQPLYSIPETANSILDDFSFFYSVINTNTSLLESTIMRSFDEMPIYKNVICDEELDKLIAKKTIYKKIDKVICPITQVEFEDQQEILTLDCEHCFDYNAILHWLKEEKSECPVCRFTYKSKEIKISSTN